MNQTLITPERFAPLADQSLADWLCIACGVYVGRITIYSKRSIGMATLCATCETNRRYALGLDEPATERPRVVVKSR